MDAKPFSEPKLLHGPLGIWFSHKKINLKMLFAIWQPFCLSLNTLKDNLDKIPWNAFYYLPNLAFWQMCCFDSLWTSKFWQICNLQLPHCNDIIMGMLAFRITSTTIVYSTLYSRRISKKTPKVRITGLSAGNSQVTSEFPTQRASNAENVSIWWHYHDFIWLLVPTETNHHDGRFALEGFRNIN